MYTDNHIYFLQHMLKVGCVTTASALEVINIINDGDNNEDNGVNLYMYEINLKISKQNLMLVTTKCEVTGTDYLCLINTNQEDIHFQNFYLPVELEYFQTILQELMSQNGKKLAKIFCLNLASHLKSPLSYGNAEKFLENCTKNGYFVDNDGEIYLGPRAIMEYSSHFRANFQEFVHLCDLCSELVFIGSVCSKCDKLWHNHCLLKFLEKQNICPNCKENWSPGSQDNIRYGDEDNNDSASSDDDDDSQTNVASDKSTSEIESPPKRKLRKKK